jgi:hypothetical protein
LAFLATGRLATADEVFRWVDAEGVVHFSQWEPEGVENVSTLLINSSNPSGYDPEDDPYSIGQQAARTSETWKQLEARRDERRKKRLEAEDRAREQEREEQRHYDYQPYPYPYSYYYRPPYYRPVLPPQPPHVVPPIYPQPPVWPIRTASEWPDPMRSAHIGVRRPPPPNSQ